MLKLYKLAAPSQTILTLIKNMAALPSTPFTLQGGCFCKAITYTVSVPDFDSRPIIEKAPVHPIGTQHEVTKRLPIISLDHCESCRRIAGTIIECWFICPSSWATFSLLPRLSDPQAASSSGNEGRIQAEIVPYLIGDKELQEKTHLRHFSSSKGVQRTFCGNCGTH